MSDVECSSCNLDARAPARRALSGAGAILTFGFILIQVNIDAATKALLAFFFAVTLLAFRPISGHHDVTPLPRKSKRLLFFRQRIVRTLRKYEPGRAAFFEPISSLRFGKAEKVIEVSRGLFPD